MENTGNKKVLIEMANAMDNDSKYEKYYGACVKYIKTLLCKNIKSGSFFGFIKDLKNDRNVNKYKSILGIGGKYDSGEIGRWANNVLNKENEFKKYSLEEIGYIMAVCRINCKINKENVEDNDVKPNKSYSNPSNRNNRNNSKKVRHYFICKNCKEKNYTEENLLFSMKRTCQKCGKSNNYDAKRDIKSE